MSSHPPVSLICMNTYYGYTTVPNEVGDVNRGTSADPQPTARNRRASAPQPNAEPPSPTQPKLTEPNTTHR
jgi:hypothetical protein